MWTLARIRTNTGLYAKARGARLDHHLVLDEDLGEERVVRGWWNLAIPGSGEWGRALGFVPDVEGTEVLHLRVTAAATLDDNVGYAGDWFPLRLAGENKGDPLFVS